MVKSSYSLNECLLYLKWMLGEFAYSVRNALILAVTWQQLLADVC